MRVSTSFLTLLYIHMHTLSLTYTHCMLVDGYIEEYISSQPVTAQWTQLQFTMQSDEGACIPPTHCTHAIFSQFVCFYFSFVDIKLQ